MQKKTELDYAIKNLNRILQLCAIAGTIEPESYYAQWLGERLAQAHNRLHVASGQAQRERGNRTFSTKRANQRSPRNSHD